MLLKIVIMFWNDNIIKINLEEIKKNISDYISLYDTKNINTGEKTKSIIMSIEPEGPIPENYFTIELYTQTQNLLSKLILSIYANDDEKITITTKLYNTNYFIENFNNIENELITEIDRFKNNKKIFLCSSCYSLMYKIIPSQCMHCR